jgi:dCTP deaminase
MSRGGALPDVQIAQLMKGGQISGADEHHLQPASLDVRLSGEIYRMRGSFLPRRGESLRTVIDFGALYRASFDFPLECNGIYLIRLEESLSLPEDVFVYNNNKSSTGRVNLHCRLLADGVPQYDRLPKGYQGELWLEVVPRSFGVRLSQGDTLSQLRFFCGDAKLSTDELRDLYAREHLLYDKTGEPIIADDLLFDGVGLSMTLDLTEDIVGYRCSPTQSRVLDFAARDLDRLAYFEPIPRPVDGMLILQRDDFYILHTKEFIRVPMDYAVEMSPYDPTKGEFRTHYAGFFDPGWGYGASGELRGTPAVLEVFTHEHEFIIRDGQPILKMVYERLAARPERSYGASGLGSNYHRQRGPKLSKHFRNHD